MPKPSPTDPTTNPARIGLIGFGCVGQGLYDIVQRRPEAGFTVARIAVKNPAKLRPLPAARFEFRADDLLDDPTLDLLVEVIDDADEAFRLVSQALRRGRRVATANKAMVARHLPALIALQREFGGTLLYEAAVCGSIPVIRTIDQYFAQEPLQQVSGIFNGSSNYVLTRMTEGGSEYAEALAEAQAQGFAETDPALDMGAFDPRSKAVILAAHAYGRLLDPETVLNLGIEHVSAADIRYAAERGKKIKVVASLQQAEGAPTVLVTPQLVAADSPLYAVEREFNGVVVDAEFAGQHFWRGRGAGGHPTGSAVLADLVALRQGRRYAYAKLPPAAEADNTAEAADLELEVYLRPAPPELRRALNLRDVSEQLSAPGFGYEYAVGYVRLSQLLRYRDALRAGGTFVARTGRVRAVTASTTGEPAAAEAQALSA